jgi:hypothetical protein
MHAHPAPPLRAPNPPATTHPLWWLWAVDAILPYVLLALALTAAQQRPGDPARVGLILIGGIAALASGTALPFFRDMPEAHVTWPVALTLATILLPLIALHMRMERDALNAPVPVHLLAVAFTYTALFVASCAAIGVILTTAARTPRWAGVAVTPVALLLGWLPVLALRTTPDDLFGAVIFVAVVAGIAAGVAWLVPERRRWWVIPLMLLIGALVVWNRFAAAPHHVPGRWLFLADAGLSVMTGAMALAAPPLCRWLYGHSAARVVRASPPPPLHRPQGTDR